MPDKIVIDVEIDKNGDTTINHDVILKRFCCRKIEAARLITKINSEEAQQNIIIIHNL